MFKNYYIVFVVLLFLAPNFVSSQNKGRKVPDNTTATSRMNPNASIVVDQTLTPLELVRDVLINSTCANVSNISVSGGNFGGGEFSYGAFNANGSIFPFQDGIILTNGRASSASDARTVSASGASAGWNGDVDLNQTLNIASSNATVLEFDFVPIGNVISFDYIFASEEYLENTIYPCTYSDGFAFLLKEVGSTTPYQNLALIPNTNIPVKVTTIHPNIPGTGGCAAQNEQYFNGFNPPDYPTVYNGQTVVLKAEANVTPYVTYHIKLVIGDENDDQYDSAIFLAGGSFNLGKDLGEDRTILNGTPICENDYLDATDATATAYQWYFNGNPISGETNAILNFTPPFNNSTQSGNYSVLVSYGATCSSMSEEIYVEFAEDLIVNNSTYTKCDADADQDGMTTFTQADFDTIKSQLFNNLPSSYQVDFYLSSTSTTPITIPFTNTSANQQIIYAKISNLESNCYPAFPVELNVNVFEDLVSPPTYILCSENEMVTLSVSNSYLNYSWNTNPPQTTSSITVSNSGTYVVTLENASNCIGTQTFTVIKSGVATIQSVNTTDFNEINTAEIIVSGNGSYEFSLDGSEFQTSNYFSDLEEGLHTVIVTDTNGCGSVSKEFYILDYPNFFTPNGDSINDYWGIKNLDKKGLQASKISIFDRYGKLLYQILPNKLGWDGNFNGQQLPASDYWFVLELADGKTVKGHFSLIR